MPTNTHPASPKGLAARPALKTQGEGNETEVEVRRPFGQEPVPLRPPQVILVVGLVGVVFRPCRRLPLALAFLRPVGRRPAEGARRVRGMKVNAPDKVPVTFNTVGPFSRF